MRPSLRPVFLPLLLLPLFVSLAAAATIRGDGPADASTSGDSPSARLHAVFDREWEYHLKEDPLFASSVGRHDYDDRLPEVAPADQRRRAAVWRELLRNLAAIDRAGLPREDQVSAEILQSDLADRVADVDFGTYQIPWNTDSGFHSEFSFLPGQTTFTTVADYDRYLARLRAWPRYVEQQIEAMREGMARGMTLPREVLGPGFERSIAVQVVEDPAASVFWQPFGRFPAAIPEAERARLRAAGAAAVRDGAVAGYRTLLAFYRGEYVPRARPTLAAYDLPDGRAFYRQQIRHCTTLDLPAERIHEIGLTEVARIETEMTAVMRQTGFAGSLAEFLHFLRTDPRFYAKTPEDLLRRAALIAKSIDGKLPSLIRTLPRTPYTVEPVPASIAPNYTAGRYVEPQPGSTQPGIYWVNTSQLESRPIYNLVALTLHEAVPGHHLQIALAREIAGLPDFRRYLYHWAFGEGWGLYSEWLGLEAGLYKDPYSNFGRLSYEMWRACRLVVDTGIHTQGWSRRQAMDFLAQHTALSLHEVETETDRYISFPGQALAFKIGELRIKELRRRAEQALGERFDVRDFHDAVLGSGSVPLPVLAENVDRFIAAHAAPPPTSAVTSPTSRSRRARRADHRRGQPRRQGGKGAALAALSGQQEE